MTRVTKKQPQHLEEAFNTITQELLETFIKKHQDYGKGNILSIKEMGIMFRESEKIERLKHLLTNGNTPNHESINDTWTDIAVYAIIATMLRRGWFQKLKLSPKKK